MQKALRLSSVVGAVLVALLLACGAHPSETSGADHDDHAPRRALDRCATPNEGCACEAAGEVVACGTVAERMGELVMCQEGTRACVGGRWGACSADGALTTKRAPSLRWSALQPEGTPCGAINPCDPYCNAFTDDPSGLVLEGDGLAADESGLYVPAGEHDDEVPTAVQTTEGGDQGCGATNLHAAPCHAGGVIDHSKCQQDFRCDVASNTCQWNGGAGYFDATADGPDLQIGAACQYASWGIIPICNRGSVAVPEGTTLGVNLVDGPPPDGCVAIGSPTCSVLAPTGGLKPGQCINLATCDFTGGPSLAVVNAGQRDVVEASGRCKNNGASAKNPLSPGCGTCTSCDTRITGKVYAPNGATPLAGISVYQPAGPLRTLVDGVACDTCASLASPVRAGATSAADGSFTIFGATPGANETLVVQSGRWRRQVSVAVDACRTNAVSANAARLPKNRSEGHIPKTAFVQGNREALECTLLKFGIDSSEIQPRTGASDAHRIQLYRVNGKTGTSTGMTTPEGLAPNASALWAAGGALDEYSVLVLPCSIEMKGGGYTSSAERGRFTSWLDRGGRAFMDHWAGDEFIRQIGGAVGATSTWASPLPGAALATLRGKVAGGTPAQALMRDWLAHVGGSVDWGLGWMRSDEPWRHALQPNPSTTTEWLRGLSTYKAMGGNQWASRPEGDFSLSYSFETPVAAAPDACPVGAGGRVIYNGMHVAQARIAGNAYPSSSNVFPSACQLAAGLTSEELALMYQFFQLTACQLGGEPPPDPPPDPPPLPTGVVFTRDFAASCQPGTRVAWHLFQWQAAVPSGTSIAFHAATAATPGALPPPPPGPPPNAAAIGVADADTASWAPDPSASPTTVDASLRRDTGGASEEHLRVYMTFHTAGTRSPVLKTWRQLYDCIPSE